MSEKRDEAFMVVGALRAAHSTLQMSGGPKNQAAREAWHEAIRFCNKAVLLEWEYAAAIPADCEHKRDETA